MFNCAPGLLQRLSSRAIRSPQTLQHFRLPINSIYYGQFSSPSPTSFTAEEIHKTQKESSEKPETLKASKFIKSSSTNRSHLAFPVPQRTLFMAPIHHHFHPYSTSPEKTSSEETQDSQDENKKKQKARFFGSVLLVAGLGICAAWLWNGVKLAFCFDIFG